jgi:peptidoglycan/xylan/chitin deacetylase (PgdA/CDA1 family)
VTLPSACLAALAAAIAIVALAGGSSHAHTRAKQSTTAARPGHAAANDAVGATGTRASATRDGESPEIRRLIALGKPIYCAGSRGDEVTLTFDDGPGPYTRLTLAKLRKHGVRATFFVVGRNIPLLPDAPREERAIGAVGDHTFTHPLLTAIAPGEAEDQIVNTQRALERSSGGRVFLFRPPYGGHDTTVDSIVRSAADRARGDDDRRATLAADYSYTVSVARITYSATSAHPSNAAASPSPVT